MREIADLRAQAEAGDAEAQFRLGEAYRFGIDLGEDEAEAAVWFAKAAAQGHEKARLCLAMHMLEAGGSERAEALAALREIAEGGNNIAQWNLGEHLLDHGEVAEGVAWLKRLAETGDDFNAMSFAQTRLGELYREGELVRKDGAEAVKWLALAAAQGQHGAACDIARMYYDGDGVDKNLVEAAAWFAKAAEHGQEDSLFRLGTMRLRGEGGPVDKAEAARLFCEGAERMDPDCMDAFGKLYREGFTAPDCGCGIVEWYRKAMEEGDRDLQLHLGLRRRGLRDALNRLNIAAAGGLVALIGLILADWALIDTRVGAAPGSASWLHVIALILIGVYLSGWMSRFRYRVHGFLRVMGLPFPVVLFEPQQLGSDFWIDFEGPFTMLSPVLNAVFAAALLVAVALLLPPATVTTFSVVMVAVAGFKSRRDRSGG